MLSWRLVWSRDVWLPSSNQSVYHRMDPSNPTFMSSAVKQLHVSTYHRRIRGQHVIDRVQSHASMPSSINHVDANSDAISSSVDTIVHPGQKLHLWSLAIKTCGRSESWMKALHLFEQLKQEGMMPEKFTFTSVLYACSNQGLLYEGKKIHACIVSSYFGSDPIIHTALISMYGKHRDFDNAMAAFEQMAYRDVVAWSALITVISQHSFGLKATQYWSQMLEEGVIPDNIALVCILDAYIYASKREHNFVLVCILFNMKEDDEATNTALVSVLGKCDNCSMAMEVFDKMRERNVLTWSAMISIQVKLMERIRALQLFNDMQEQGCLPNQITFLSVASACTSEEGLGAGRQLHALLVGGAQKIGPSLGNSLLNMYNKCRRFEDAAYLFQTLSEVDVITFTSMIAATLKDRNAESAFDYLKKMISIGHAPDQVMFTTLLEVGTMVSDIIRVQCLHSFIVECEWDNELILSNSRLNAYCKPGNLMEACWIFDRIVVHDAISWNAIVGLYAQLGDSQEALQLFHRMQEEVFFDKITILNMLGCITCPSVVIHGKRLHTLVIAKRLELELDLRTSLVSMYGRCGKLPFAKQVFGETQEVDLLLWRELVVAYSSNGQVSSVKLLFDRLLAECLLPDHLCFACLFSSLCECVAIVEVRRLHVQLRGGSFVSDVSANNALMSCYGSCGGSKDVHELFYKMQERDSVSWNTLLSVCNLHCQNDESKYIQEKMCWEGYLPDLITWSCRLVACVNSTDLAEGKRVHACLRHYALDTEGFVGTALVNMYGKCGNVSEARKIFDTIGSRNLVSWNTMIAVYSQHGLGKAAVNLFNLMLFEKLSPDEATFASVLAACSHAGLLVEGCDILVCMTNCGFTPSEDDISCVIDLLARVGMLDEAESLLNAQPENITVKSLRALLSACRHQKDVERGERTAQKVMHIDSNASAVYVLLSNLYVHDDAPVANVAAMNK